MYKNLIEAALCRGLIRDPSEAASLHCLPMHDREVGKTLEGIAAFSAVRHVAIALGGAVSVEPLSELPHLETLVVYGSKLKDLNALATLPCLRYLKLFCPRQRSLQGLTSETLEWLDVADCGITSLEELGPLPALRALKLSRNGLKDLAGIEDAKRLQHVDISYTKVKSLEPLRGLSALASLDMDGISVSELASLGQCSSLWRLSAVACKRLRSLEGLGAAPLRSLVLAQTPVKDLGPVRVDRLEHLNIVSTRLVGKVEIPLPVMNSTNSIFGKDPAPPVPPVSTAKMQEMRDWLAVYDAEPRHSLEELEPSDSLRHLVVGQERDGRTLSLVGIERFPRLRTLTVRMAVESFSPLREASDLLSLVAPSPCDGDVTPLLSLPRLRRLELSGSCEVGEVVSQLRELRVLTLGSMKLDDVSFLANHNELVRLDLSGNALREVAPLAALTGLRKLRLHRNPIADPTVLAPLGKRVEL